MTLYYRTPELPWSDSADKRRFGVILVLLLALVLVPGLIIPRISLPQPDRAELEKLPPQLARVLERKKAEPPKPVTPPPEEKKPAPEPEPKPVPEVKPEPPKPQPKPKAEPKVQATQEQREQAREKARERFGGEALSALQSLRSKVPVQELNTASRNLSNAGQQATDVGSVVDRNAVARTSGGVDTSQLTQATVGEQLQDRQLTAVELTAEQQQAVAESRVRTQEELRTVIEEHRIHFDRQFRMALRRNPALAGSVTLKAEIQPDGKVSSCSVSSSELKDDDLHKRLLMQCRRMDFGSKPVEVAVTEFPIRFVP
ncbi:AgmX/PglI C-terminal domain-containing protein [Venatoribacter cucullus]|uniref:AgmX/PglI C-terminal domain-containing protein n=1 Tax=Venatoribacter cucullus TaxID=2661630 RepID=A0A9X7UWK4_9GAMM|nr:AgmX/PglI C-terminal domain-containing protein [Venatoribacter cucullus]QQD24219.1 AgmX/PglI C-terminal domain-containing protein [Venatoribacter cucullus]